MESQPLLDFVMAHPELSRAIRRHASTEGPLHQLYDSQLTLTAVQDGWTDDAIVALLTWVNERGGVPPLNRVYISVLIGDARHQYATGAPGLVQDAQLEHVSQEWGLEIHRVLRHGRENSLWHLVLADGQQIALGSTKQFMSANDVRRAIFDVTQHIIPRYRPHEMHVWDAHIQMLARAATLIDTPEMTRAGYIKGLIKLYLEKMFIYLDQEMAASEWEDWALGGRPYIRDGMVHLTAEHLWGMIRRNEPKMDKRDLLDLFRLIDGKRHTITIHCENSGMQKTSRSYWLFDPSLFQEGEEPARAHPIWRQTFGSTPQATERLGELKNLPDGMTVDDLPPRHNGPLPPLDDDLPF